MWVHCDYADPAIQHWLSNVSDLDSVVAEALLAQDPRPRAVRTGDGLMVILRGINLNRGAEPEDMIAVRAWADAERIITLRHRPIAAAHAVREAALANGGPDNVGELLWLFVDRLLDDIAIVVDQVDDVVHELEHNVLDVDSLPQRHRLGQVRRQAIALRRFLAPQREVLSRLAVERVDWLDDMQRTRFRELADRLIRSLEELDAARDRAAVTQEELASRVAEQMNNRLYVLSVVAAIFLPLSLITGLWGVNLGGIPGGSAKWGFMAMCGGLVVATVGQLWLFRRLGWLGGSRSRRSQALELE